MAWTYQQVAIYIIGGVFILFLIATFIWLIYKFVWKAGLGRGVKIILLSMRRKKLLKDEGLLAYCIARIEKDFKEVDVRKELMLANRHSLKRVDEICYVYSYLLNEMKGGILEDGSIKGKGGTKAKVAEDLPK